MSSSLSLDATSLNGFDQTTYISQFFSALTTGKTSFYGGTADSAYGGTYYMNGDQVLTRFSDAETGTQSSAVVLTEGEEIAYDFMHYGASYGHGISGAIDSVTFAQWVDGTTAGTQGTGDAGEITGLEEGLVIDGFDLSAAAGSGPDATTNAVYALYSAIKAGDAAAINSLIATYDLEVTGSSGADTLKGFGGDDVLSGRSGDDVITASSGNDMLLGGAGADDLQGNRGNDTMRGGSGDDVLTGGRGNDLLTGGAGADTFVLKVQSGRETITDFTAGTDVIDLTALDLTGLEDLSITSGDDFVSLSVEGVTLRLAGVTADEITSDFFLF